MATRISHLRFLLAVALLAPACGDEDRSNPDSDAQISEADAAPDSDGQPPADATPACGRELVGRDQIDDATATAIDEIYLYVVEDASVPFKQDIVRVWRVHRERGEAELLATLEDQGRPTTVLLVDQDAIYLVTSTDTDTGTLYRVGKGGPGQVLVVDGDPAEAIAADDTHIYWFTNYIGGEFEPTIKRRSKAGGEVQILDQGQDLSTDTRVAVTGGFLYFNQDVGARLMRMPTAGGEKEFLGLLVPDNLNVDIVDLQVGPDGLLYWLYDDREGTFGFSRSPLAAFEPQPLVTEPATSLRAPFFVEGDALYWAVSLGPEASVGIRRAPASGGKAVTVYPQFGSPFVPTPVGIYIQNIGVSIVPLEGCP